MKRTVVLTVSIVLVMLLVACQPVPQKVVENMTEYGDNKQVSNTAITYCQVDEIEKNDIGDIIGQFDNISISIQPNFKHISSLDRLEMRVYNEKNLDEVINKYAKLFDINSTNKQVWEDELGEGDGYYIDDENEKKFLEVNYNYCY